MNRLNFLKILFKAVIISALLAIMSCAGTGQRLSTHPAQEKNLLQGTYTVVLYGGQHTDDFETVAILDLEGDEYALIPFGATFGYRTRRDMNGRDALQAAEAFLRSSLTAYNNHKIRQITGPGGSAIGYELRPLLLPFVYGESDLLNISYALQADKEVTVSIYIKDSVDRRLFFRLFE